MKVLDSARSLAQRASRNAILRTADSDRVRAFMTRFGMRLGARRFVPAVTLDEAVGTFRALNEGGMRGVTGLFDDTAHDEAGVARHEGEYGRAIQRFADNGINVYMSLKLSHLGILFDSEVPYASTKRLAELAGGSGRRIRIDMEESELVDPTLGTYRRLREAGIDNVGVVLQSYLHRSERDLDELLPFGLNVRLVKGAYLEPGSVAYQEKRDVDASYGRMLERALGTADFTAIATHDRRIIERAKELIRERALGPDRYEFQMLYGVATRLQAQIVAEGYPLAVAAPYGRTWFPYLMRRLAERPANLAFVLRNVFN